MARKFSELRAKMSAESQARSQARADEMLKDMPLAEVRHARELTQQQLARSLKVNQAWISKVERQTDMYLSTLRAYIEAMGGELDIIARFDDGAVRINQLKELDPQDEAIFQHEQASSNILPANARERPVSVWTPQPSGNTKVWDNAGKNTTSRTPSPNANTNSTTSKAA